MKPVSDKFKESIKKYGRQIDAIITYTDEEGEHLLDSDVLFSITPTVNGNILKSVMKQLEFESSVKVPKGTIIKAQLGVQIDLSLTVEEINAMLVQRLNSTSVNLLSAGLKGFEYITFGNYIVSEDPEYNADALSYHHKCYDKMLYSMKKYEKLSITYPISIRDYIKKICSYLGLTFKNANDVFANYNKQIKKELYEGYDYTFRDILDELAQVTASTICINENTDELEIRYLNNTQDSINEDYLKDVNVEFGKVYGPINSIVLSRSGESDNVYLPNEESIKANGLCELKIVDNQIMNDNDRSDFLPDILAKLNGTSYCINDFSSYGIAWYELCDMYTVEIGAEKYNCVLLNDEIKITQGLEETIYTEMPTVSETDYTKADKTDRRINKAYIIVDKKNQEIEARVSKVEGQIGENCISNGDFENDLTDWSISTASQTSGSVTIKEENDTKYAQILSKADSTKLIQKIRDLKKDIEYTLMFNAYDNGDLDIDLENGIFQVDIKQYREEGSEEVIEQISARIYVTKENKSYTVQFIPGEDVDIELIFTLDNPFVSDYTMSVMLSNVALGNGGITEQLAKLEMKSNKMNLEVGKKVNNEDFTGANIMLKINDDDSSEAQINADKININGTVSANGNFKVDTNGNMECNNAKITGGKINLTSGTMVNPNFMIEGKGISASYAKNRIFSDSMQMSDGTQPLIALGFGTNANQQLYGHLHLETSGSSVTTDVNANGITTPTLTQTSLAEQKKNFEKLEDNAIDIIKNIDIYKYNLKSENDTDKKHIGFVIGEGYNYSEEVTSLDNKGVDNYSFTSLCCKAIQEQQEIIERLQKQIKELKEGK